MLNNITDWDTAAAAADRTDTVWPHVSKHQRTTLKTFSQAVLGKEPKLEGLWRLWQNMVPRKTLKCYRISVYFVIPVSIWSKIEYDSDHESGLRWAVTVHANVTDDRMFPGTNKQPLFVVKLGQYEWTSWFGVMKYFLWKVKHWTENSFSEKIKLNKQDINHQLM